MEHLFSPDGKPTMAEVINKLPENTRIVDRIMRPDHVSVTSVSYTEKTYMGREMRKGDTIVYELPTSIQELTLDAVSIDHRKDKKYASSIQYNVKDKNGVLRKVSDTEGAYTRVLVFDGKAGKWVCWSDPYKRSDDINYGAKYAEKRSPASPEHETLYDWAKQGDIEPLYVAVVATGEGPRAVTNYHGLEVQVFPDDSDDPKQELIFSKGTKFVNRKDGITEPIYGGGARHGNAYPDSLPLGSVGPRAETDISAKGDTCRIVDGRTLEINVDHEYDFSRLEVAVGDTHPDGTLGWAKLSAKVIYTDRFGYTQVEPLFDNQNVPPNGVIKGSLENRRRVQPGDKILISSNADTAYVMGVRTQ